MILAEYTVGDTGPDVVLLLIEDGGVKDLTGVLVVLLKMRKPSGEEVSRAMTIDSTPTTGLASYTPTVDDFDEEGDYDCDVRVTAGDGSIQHALAPFTIVVRSEYGEAA